MLTQNLAISEYIRLLKMKSAAVTDVAPLESAWISSQALDGARRMCALCGVTGAWTDAETLTFRWEKASDASGTGAATVKEIVRSAHATANDDILMMMDLSHLDIDTAKPFNRVTVLASAGSGGQAALAIVGGDMRHTPQDDAVTSASTGLVKILRLATGT